MMRMLYASQPFTPPPPAYLNVDEEDGKSEGMAPSANSSPATPPGKNPNKEATRTNESPYALASTRSEEATVGDACVADGR